jgi:mannitol-1-phosphate/altronate dehydrogenase
MAATQKLCNSSLASLRGTAARAGGLALPGYDRSVLGAGIVHLGVGQFHRSHMAAYTDDALAAGGAGARNWGICGVGLMPQDEAMRDALRAQDHLYSLQTRAGGGAPTRARVIGSHVDNLFAPADPQAVLARLSAASTRIISLTVTEKGYGADLAARQLDPTDAAIAHDLATPGAPQSAVGFVAAAMRARWAAGLAPPTVLSCDNIQGNGEVLRELVSQFVLSAAKGGGGGGDAAQLERWIREHGAFPNTMVDRITPGASAADAAELAAAHGVEDAAPVGSEAFTQWVLEENFVEAAGGGGGDNDGYGGAGGARPAWGGDAIFAPDVAPYEKMKLRLLNASHSCLAYAALLRGHSHVHAAMADGAVRGLVAAHMREAAPTVPPVPGVELGPYCETLVTRFANEAVADTVLRLAEDGSMKMPGFLGGAVADALAAVAPDQGLPAAELSLSCWMRCLVDVPEMKEPRVAELRPLAGAALEAAAAAAAGGAQGQLDAAVEAFLQQAMGPQIAAHAVFRVGIGAVLQDMQREGPAACIERRVLDM